MFNVIQPDTSLNENRAPPTQSPTTELHANCDTSTHSPTGNNQYLVSDIKQLYCWNPKIPHFGSVPYYQLSDVIHEYDNKLSIQHINHRLGTNKTQGYEEDCTPNKSHKIINYNNERNIFNKNEGNILRSYPKDKKAMNSSHPFNVINKIQTNTSLIENRASST